MLTKQLLERISKPDSAMSRVGYWVSGVGLILTLAMGFSSFAVPSIRASKFWKVPPCLILAGLALEGYEAIAQSRRNP
jgi:hypothetical protein